MLSAKLKKFSGSYIIAFLLIVSTFTACRNSADTAKVANPQQNTSQPNVLIILTDDQGWGDVGVHGNPHLQTPSMDRLANNGVQIDDFYVSSVCAPTRASLMTGRYHLRTGVQWVTRGLERMNTEEVTLAELFAHNKYQTALFGKWHNGAMAPYDPLSQGFQEFFGFAAGHWDTYFDAPLQYGNQMVQTKGFLPDVLTDSTITFIERQTAKAEPFFAYVAYNTPHSPFQVPEQFYKRFKRMNIPEKDKAIYAMIENLDFNIERITKSLEQNGALDNTLIIFMGDNGPNGVRYNAGLKGVKASVNEGGLKVPSFWHWPNKWQEGKKLNGWATHIDVFPTLVSLLDLTKPANSKAIDGSSIATLLNSDSQPISDKIHFSHHSQTVDLQALPGSVRAGNFRAVGYENSAWELYNLAQDPNQNDNIAAQNKALTDSLSAAYMAWFKEVSANLPDERWTPLDANPAVQVEIPAHEAYPANGTKYAGGYGWAGDWVSGFDSKEAAIRFPVSNQEYATYTVQFDYSLASVDPNSIPAVQISYSQEGSKTTRVGSLSLMEKNAEIIENPDRIARGEAPQRAWLRSEKTVINLPIGNGYVIIQPVVEDGLKELEIKTLILKKN